MTTYKEKLKQIKELFITNGIQPETFDSIVQCKSQFLKKPFKNISIETVQNYLTNFIALSDLLDTELDALAKRDFQIFYNNPEYIKEKTCVNNGDSLFMIADAENKAIKLISTLRNDEATHRT